MIFLLPFATALAASPAAVPDTHARTYLLDNGLRVVIERQDRTDTAALFIRYGVGSRDERDGEHGCAHLFEHLMFEGSAHVPGDAFDRWLTDAGGDNNAWTSHDETVYHMTFPAGALDLALFLESDRMGGLDAGLTATNLANQQDVVLQERSLGYDAPGGRDTDALDTLTFDATHPYHTPVIGTISDVRGFTLDAVRGFWQTHYRPRNAVLVLVGPFDPDEAAKRVAYWFSDVVDTGEAPPRPEAPEARAPSSRGVLYDRVEERTVYLSWPTVADHAQDATALSLASYILDDGAGTRLHVGAWRKPAITSAVAWSYGEQIDGSMVLAASSPTIPLARLEKQLLKEVHALTTEPVSESELSRAKAALVADSLDGVDLPWVRARMFMSCMTLYGEPNCLERELERIDAVTPESLLAAASSYLTPEHLHVLNVLPENERNDDAANTVVLP